MSIFLTEERNLKKGYVYILLLFLYFIQLLAHIFLFEISGAIAGGVAVFPAITMSYYFGKKGAIIGVLALFASIIALTFIFSTSDFNEIYTINMWGAQIFGAFTVYFVCLVTARMKDLNMQLFDEEKKRKEIEDKIKKSEKTYRNLIETSPDAIIVCDMNGKISKVNQTALDLFDYKEKEKMLKNNLFKILAPKDQEDIKESIKNSLYDEDTVVNKEYFFTKNKDKKFLGEVSMSIVNEKKKSGIKIILTVKDITLKKAQEEELQAKNNELEQFTNVLKGRDEKLAVMEAKLKKYYNSKK